MITLNVRGVPFGIRSPIIAKVALSEDDKTVQQPRVLVSARLPEPHAIRPGRFAALVSSAVGDADVLTTLNTPIVHSCPTEHIEVGDVLRIEPTGAIRTLFRRRSRNNTLFATERCNSLCVMCSQPPRSVDDDWRVDEMMQTIRLADKNTVELGISGGEPTLLGDGLLRVLTAARDELPNTALHVLSNGRLFRYTKLARAVGEIQHHDLMFGIPLYSDLDYQHDYVVQAQGAFEDTILGLYNLAKSGVPVEIRVVVHRHTFSRLTHLADFIYRNLTFASHVAFMGLEATGFAKANMDDLWIDPLDYAQEMAAATGRLAARGMRVSIYNHPLCVVPDSVWSLCRQSISDWKNEFLPACTQCAVRETCGGFFAFNLKSRMSRGIAPIAAGDARLVQRRGALPG